MANNKNIIKRIFETKTEIFPLDRMLPLETVYLLFLEEYNKVENKEAFAKNNIYNKRLREGYFSLFAALSLNDNQGKKQYLVFPSDPGCDVYILNRVDMEEDKFDAFAFDIKEFTDFSKTFIDFIDKSIVPKLDIYSIIIGTHRKIKGSDLKYLSDQLKIINSMAKVWLVGSPSNENDENNISKVTIVDKEQILYDKIIVLDDWLDEGSPPIIYEDFIRFEQENKTTNACMNIVNRKR